MATSRCVCCCSAINFERRVPEITDSDVSLQVDEKITDTYFAKAATKGPSSAEEEFFSEGKPKKKDGSQSAAASSSGTKAWDKKAAAAKQGGKKAALSDKAKGKQREIPPTPRDDVTFDGPNPKVMLISLKAGALGLNLTVANNVYL